MQTQYKEAAGLSSETARPISFCKGHFPWKILKSMGKFWRSTKAKTRALFHRAAKQKQKCLALNFFLDNNRITNQIYVCCILLGTDIQLLFDYPENHVEIWLVILFLSTQGRNFILSKFLCLAALWNWAQDKWVRGLRVGPCAPCHITEHQTYRLCKLKWHPQDQENHSCLSSRSCRSNGSIAGGDSGRHARLPGTVSRSRWDLEY